MDYSADKASAACLPCRRRVAPRLFLLVLLLFGCSTQSGIYHTVTEGQTLYRIGRAYGVDERYLARINRIDDPTHLRVGQRLFIPGAERPKVVTAPAPLEPSTGKGGAKSPVVPASAKSPAVVTPPIDARTSKPVTPLQPARAPVPSSSAPPTQSDTTVRPKGKFVWPLNGRLLRRFGDAGNPPCKGLEIAAARGTPVLSAAPGHVIYSGDGIRSYGNLVILRHDDDYFTVYGYNDTNLVKAGSFVSKGDRIALSGTAPGGGAPRLYFEIRRGKEAVNPIFYLP